MIHRQPEKPGTPIDLPEVVAPFQREARFFERVGGGKVLCTLCPHACTLGLEQTGRCHVRQNRDGVLSINVYGRVSAAQVDPIEKKPFFHFLPASCAFSIGTAGCNVSCTFCQNWQLAQSRPSETDSEFLPAERAVELALANGAASIAFTYNEPAIFAEYAIDVVDAAHQAGLRCLAVSNGYVQPGLIAELYGRMDAVKIDLKAFRDDFYRQVVGARLGPVLDTLVALKSMGKWMEIVYLVIPTLNDSDAELTEAAAWIRANLGPDVPLHFSRFHPQYKLQHLPPTPVETLERARALAQAEGLHYVYIGNVPGHAAQNTLCPGCGQLLVERAGFATGEMLVNKDNRCPHCQQSIAGIWRPGI